jgi:hypothetical protein
LNNSVPSFRRLPSPAVSSRNMHATRGYPPYRTTTPMSQSLQSVRGGPWNDSVTSLRSMAQSPAESTGPHYYDYSESFLEGDNHDQPGDRDGWYTPTNGDHPALHSVPERRQAQSPFGTMPGSFLRPAELPTRHHGDEAHERTHRHQHSRRPSEQSKQSNHSFVGVIPSRVSSLAATKSYVTDVVVNLAVSLICLT